MRSCIGGQFRSLNASRLMDRQFSSAISMPVLAGMCEGGVHILSQNVKILTHYFDFLYIDLDYIIISTCHCFVF